MTRKRVLFVDDEMSVLKSLAVVLRKQRDALEMVFVSTAVAAFAELEKAPFDVVVTDLRMPGVDGVELLGRVATMSPSTVRILLSGYGGTEAMARAGLVADTCLPKPCSVDTLVAAIAAPLSR
jgi:DNA-binding NtrC family response regulator